MKIKATEISRGVFNREIAQCKELSKKNGGKCNWGKYDSCGVIPLLYKLFSGEIFEKKDEIEEIKQKNWNKSTN